MTMNTLPPPPHELLAQEFHAVGERRARDGYWGDFTSPLATPQTALYQYATAQGYDRIAQGVLDGRFDG